MVSLGEMAPSVAGFRGVWRRVSEGVEDGYRPVGGHPRNNHGGVGHGGP
jgi:hypothetical protein